MFVLKSNAVTTIILGLGLFLNIITYSISTELPDYIQVCHQSDPKINDCIIESIDKIKPYLVKGIPELDVPPLEPLRLGDLVLVDGNNGNTFKITASNVTVYGAGNFRIKKLTTNGNILEHIRVDLNLPHLKVDGRYNADGQLLTFPVKGNGRFNGEFINLNSIVRIDTEVKKYNGAERFGVKTIKLNSRMEKGKIKLHDLFGGDKTLGQVVNEAINSNFDVLSTEFIPIIEKELEIKFKEIADKISLKFTYEQLIPM